MELAQSTLSASFIDKGARQLLLRLLGRLEHGQLLLRDGGERHSFGAAGSDSVGFRSHTDRDRDMVDAGRAP